VPGVGSPSKSSPLAQITGVKTAERAHFSEKAVLFPIVSDYPTALLEFDPSSESMFQELRQPGTLISPV
jgi:hypothetical protein